MSSTRIHCFQRFFQLILRFGTNPTMKFSCDWTPSSNFLIDVPTIHAHTHTQIVLKNEENTQQQQQKKVLTWIRKSIGLMKNTIRNSLLHCFHSLLSPATAVGLASRVLVWNMETCWIPSRERTYPTFLKRKNHRLKSTFGMGSVIVPWRVMWILLWNTFNMFGWCPGFIGVKNSPWNKRNCGGDRNAHTSLAVWDDFSKKRWIKY